VADILRWRFHGFFAWWLWRTIHLCKLPGLERKVRVALDWTLDLVFPRDITLLDAETLSVLNRRGPQPSLAGYLAAHLSQAQSGDYLALMAYLQRSAEHHATLQAMRVRLRKRLHVATTLGYGPRFLHSTGQLHKGGANNGLFIQLTADDRDDLAIPGEPYSFGTLKQAPALGDFQALRNKGRRVFRPHLGVDVRAGLEQLRAALAQAVPGQP
jgi:transaldolase/glucose-6-phosphate isomerase